MTVDLSRRFYLNQVVTSTDALFSAHEWDVLAVDDRIEPGDEIVLGFDGGKTSDATALVACRVSDRMFQVMGVWENPGGTLAEHWEVPRDEVDDTVRHTMANYKVSAFFADVELWESYIQQWSLDYRNDLLVKASPKSWVAYDFRQHIKDVTLANERLISAVIDGQVKHTGDPAMRRHVLNVHRRLNNWGVSFGKENRWSKNKIDIYAAMVAADEARVRYLESGKRRISKRMVVGSW
jgi:phage terminase large subunit-like protein